MIYRLTEHQYKRIFEQKQNIREKLVKIKQMSNGNIIFHGGQEKIEKLDEDKIEGGARSVHGYGLYFTSSPDKALDYGRAITYLDISNLNILDIRKEVTNGFARKIEKVGMRHDSILIDYFTKMLNKEIGNSIDMARKNIMDKMRYENNKNWSNMLRIAGYDIMKNGYEYVVINFDKANNYLINDINEYLGNDL